MKNNIVSPAAPVSLIFYCCLIFLFATVNTGCRKDPASGGLSSDVSLDGDASSEATPLTQLVLWIKPGVPRDSFFAWRKNVIAKAGAVNISKACGDCDSSLMLLTGKGIETYIKGHTVSGGVGTNGTDSDVSGDTSIFYHSLNYRLSGHPLPFDTMSFTGTAPVSPYTELPVKVGILDTGADTFEVKNYPYKPDSASCIKLPGANFGWNFVNFSSNIADDEANKHGSTVTRFVTDYFDKNDAGKVQILPVKTHNAAGVGNLFDILCGMAYAQKMGVKIINASFGFYLPVLDSTTIPKVNYIGDPNVRLLKNYVFHYLTRNKILLVAAAGNKDTDSKKLAFIENYSPYTPNDPQILNQVPFYPACLAKDPSFPNVLAVTTVFVDASGNGIMSDQNYSNNIVDVGVIADAVRGTHFFEKDPRIFGHAIEGSSYATPIVTGKIASNYYMLKNLMSQKSFTRNELLNALQPLFLSNSSLRSKIKDGRVMKK